MYTSNGNSRPKQRVASGSKDKKWADDSAEYYLSACVDAVDKERALKNYRLMNGQLDESEYLYVTNPLNTQRSELKGYPAKLANYDILSPNFNLLMGEKVRRQFPPIVFARNSNNAKFKEEEYKRLLTQEIQKRFINAAIQVGAPFDEEQITIELEQIAAKIKKLPDTIASLGQDALEYIMDFNQLPSKFRQGFYDWIGNSCVYSYKDVFKGDTYYETISPINIGYMCSRPFIKNGEAVRATHFLSVNEIYDRFQDAKGFDAEVRDFLDDYGNRSTSIGYENGYFHSMSDIDMVAMQHDLLQRLMGQGVNENYAEGMRVDHVVWRSQAKCGKLLVPNMFGEPEYIEVDDTFKPRPNDIIEWYWKDEAWENYKIADRYWIGGSRLPIQNEKEVVLPYNGRSKFTRHTRPKSLPEQGEVYQKSVNIVKYRAESTLAKNLDKVILFPLGLIPKKEGWDEDKLMYYVRAFSFLFFDESKPNAHLLIQAMKDLDMSTLQHVLQSYQLVQIFKQEWDDVCGINRQRKGDIGVSAGKAVTQQAEERSYVMSEEMFLEFEEFERSEYTDMLELSKYAFANGKQAHFVRPDGSIAFLNILDPESYLWAELGVFVKNGSKELTKLEMLRNQVTAFAQNQVDPKMVSAIIESENFAQLHQIMDDIDAKLEARRQQDIALQQEATESAERIADREYEFKYYNANLVSATDIHVALIDEGIATAEAMQKLEQQGQTNTEEYGKLRGDLEKNAIELMKNATNLKKIASDERANIRDNKTALKNKVAGEK